MSNRERGAEILCRLAASRYFCTIWLFHSVFIVIQLCTCELDCETHTHTHTLFQIRSIMPHDSTRGLSSTVPVELVLEFDPVFSQFPIHSLSDTEPNFSLSSDLQCKELNSPVPQSHLVIAAEKQHLRGVVEGCGCSP